MKRDAKWRSDFPEAYVSHEATLGADVRIGAGSIVYGQVEIGADTTVGEYCVLGHCGPGDLAPLVVGQCSTIRSYSILYAASRFGAGLETGHHVVIRERTVAGANLRVGNFSDLEGDCSIGDFCRFHGYTHVGKGSRIGHFVWLFSLTTATNDPLPPSTLSEPVTIEDGAVVCVGVTMMPGTVIRRGALVSAGTLAQGTIPPGAVVEGPDCRVVSHVTSLVHFASGTRHPWMRHFHAGYPREAQERLRHLLEEVTSNRFTLPLDPG